MKAPRPLRLWARPAFVQWGSLSQSAGLRLPHSCELVPFLPGIYNGNLVKCKSRKNICPHCPVARRPPPAFARLSSGRETLERWRVLCGNPSLRPHAVPPAFRVARLSKWPRESPAGRASAGLLPPSRLVTRAWHCKGPHNSFNTLLSPS